MALAQGIGFRQHFNKQWIYLIGKQTPGNSVIAHFDGLHRRMHALHGEALIAGRVIVGQLAMIIAMYRLHVIRPQRSNLAVVLLHRHHISTVIVVGNAGIVVHTQAAHGDLHAVFGHQLTDPPEHANAFKTSRIQTFRRVVGFRQRNDRKPYHAQQQHPEHGQHAPETGSNGKVLAPFTATHDTAMANHLSPLPVFTEFSIDSFVSGNRLTAGFAPHRHVAGNLATLPDRRGIGQHPVIVAVLAAILDQPGPRATGFQCCPEIIEGLDRHVRMTHDIVRLANQLNFGKSRYRQEIFIDVGNLSLQISLGDDQVVVSQLDFFVGDGQIGSHLRSDSLLTGML